MFLYVEIAFVKSGIAMSISGTEYQLINNQNADCILAFQLLKQLKLSSIQYGFTIIDDTCYLLREINPELELIDGTIRFNYNDRTVLNNNDIFLFNEFLETTGIGKGNASIFVKWGKKKEYFIDVLNDEQNSVEFEAFYLNYRKSVKDPIALKQRFKILLNESFLNKMKTYIQLWKTKYNIAYDLPAWFGQLYNLK
ncbi:MAG: hypothetical protein AB8B74_14570 [Crocinitomicaceae bacterium]